MARLKALVSAVFLVAFVGVVSATVTLKVGLYNYIPDLNNNGLQSYNAMIEDGFNSINENEQVDTIVDKLVYNPFGNLTKYILDDGFDLLEINLYISLKDLVDDGLLVPNVFTTEGVLPATEIASQVDGVSFAYPTIVTGSFLISYSPGEEIGCRVEEGKPNFEDFFRTLDECHDIFFN